MSVWERNWKMNVGEFGLEAAEFSLQKHRVDGIVYYTMKVDKCGEAEAEAWGNCRLVQRGLHPMRWAPLPALEPFDDSDDYDPEINKWLKRVTAATLRLEGEIELVAEPPESADPLTAVSVTPLMVTMFVAKDAVTVSDEEMRDLLLVRIRSTGAGLSIVPGPDGTGHGDPTKKP